jgi:DNA mismatch repair ATPase MutS
VKAFLMHRDRDFDPQRLLSRREKESRFRRSDQTSSLDQLLPWNERALRQDLGLDVVFREMARGDTFLFEVAQVAVLSSVIDPDTIRYRQDILEDCSRNEPIVRDMYALAIEAIERERKEHFGILSRSPGLILYRSVATMQMFAGMLRRLRDMADQHAQKFVSDGLSRLCSMLRQELSDEYFDQINHHLKRLRFRRGVLISARLGKANKGTNYVLRRPHGEDRNWLSRLLSWNTVDGYSYQLHPRDEAGARALSGLRDQGINLVANALAQSTDHILSFFEMLRTELAFYIGCLNLRGRLDELGQSTCFPCASPVGDRALSFSGLNDIALALSAGNRVVANDLVADGRDLFVIMGANSGGKSTFLRSVGQAQLMMQAGMFVAAASFAAEVRDSLLTHFKREEDATMESGKLDEELKRMSEIIDRAAPNSIVLFNESFAATNEREGSEIARQITTALVGSGMKVFFVTHLYEFAFRLHEKMPDTIFLNAERRSDGKRTFRIVAGEPSETSYGRDLYARIFGSECAPSDASESREPVRLSV